MRTSACLTLIALLVVGPEPSRAQIPLSHPETPLGIIDTVIIGGNHKTKDYVILNEMALRRGDTVTAEGMDYDRDRIYSLGLFTRVDVMYDSLEHVKFLYVDVNERWYLIPFPILGFRDGDTKRFFFGAGLMHENLGGRNQKLRTLLILGADPEVSLAFADPLILRDERIFFAAGLSFNRLLNKSEVEVARTGPFDEFHYDVNVTFGKRFTLTQVASINAGFRHAEVSAWWPGRTISPNGKDKFLYGTASYVLDSRDLFEYPSRGGYAALYATKYGFGEAAVNFTRFGTDLRGYIPLPLGFTLATRFQGSIVSGGEVPVYAHVFFGYGERLRGWFNTVLEGDDCASATIELHHYLLTPRVFRMTSLPIPEEFAVWRFGISAAIFANTGNAWYRGQKLTPLYSGYGAGLHFLLPYSLVVRVEYALNQYRNGEFILDLRGAI